MLLPWTRPPYGYRVSPDRPRDPRGVTTDPAEAVIVAELFALYREPGFSLTRLAMHLDQRGVPTPTGTPRWSSPTIRGILIVGLMDHNRLPANLAPLWDEFPSVVTGVRTREPALSFACSDHHALALEALEKAVSLGYQRPALVLDSVIDQLTEGRFTAGFLTGQSRLVPGKQRVHAFYDVAAARGDRSLFAKWLEKNKPD